MRGKFRTDFLVSLEICFFRRIYPLYVTMWALAFVKLKAKRESFSLSTFDFIQNKVVSDLIFPLLISL